MLNCDPNPSDNAPLESLSHRIAANFASDFYRHKPSANERKDDCGTF
jgi:hypothetical protein